VAEDAEVRVWDSTAEVRYLVLPERPPGTEAITEDQLAALVTRDSMIGVAQSLSPPRQRLREPQSQCSGIPPACINPADASKALQSSLNFSDGLLARLSAISQPDHQVITQKISS
jgi:hypothetical protein